jgi:hypothetical protein
MTQEELLALLKGISYEKPNKESSSHKSTANFEEGDYIAPSAAAVLGDTNVLGSVFGEGMSLGDFETLQAAGGPCAENFVSREWKVRQQAFDEAKVLFDKSSGDELYLKDLAPAMELAADDSNASANDSALEMIFSW